MSGSMDRQSGASNPQAVADALLRARSMKQPVDDAPLANALHGPDDAYRAQDLVAQALGNAGSPRYWKSGGASRPAVLTHAALPEFGVKPSPADLRGMHFNMRLIEAEVALRLAKDIDTATAATLEHQDANGLVDAMCVSIEIVDSRWRRGREADALMKLADLQSHGALVLGEWKPFAPRDWSRQLCTVRIGDAAPAQFTGTHSLDDPAWLLPIWLRHATRNGATVARGTVVTTGTWCGVLTAQEGDLVRVTFDGIGEASVQL